MQTLDAMLSTLVRSNLIDKQEAVKRCAEEAEFERLLSSGAGAPSPGHFVYTPPAQLRLQRKFGQIEVNEVATAAVPGQYDPMQNGEIPQMPAMAGVPPQAMQGHPPMQGQPPHYSPAPTMPDPTTAPVQQPVPPPMEFRSPDGAPQSAPQYSDPTQFQQAMPPQMPVQQPPPTFPPPVPPAGYGE